MNDFQEQAKNWLRNVVKQNPDKIKAGVDKAGDLIDKHTDGKYAEKVDAVQQKAGAFVESQASEGTSAEPSAEQASEANAGGVPSPGGGGAPEAEVVGGEAPDPASVPESSAGSGTEGATTGSTATGQTETGPTEGGLPGPRQ